MKYLFIMLSIGYLSGGCFSHVFGQITVKGKVTDAETGDPLPYAAVKIKKLNKGTTTSFDGNYSLSIPTNAGDSIEVVYLGYVTRTKAFKQGVNQTINFQLNVGGSLSTKDVLISASTENPAHKIIKRAVSVKEVFSPKSLTAYECETYNKVEIDVNNIGPRFKNRKLIKEIKSLMDSVQVLAGEDGKAVLPIFISEALSKVYYRKKPQLKREDITHTRVSGIGLSEASVVSQFLGASFQQYDFYDNYLTIVTKNFPSPICDNWRLIYDYELEDSVMIEDDYCYQLKVTPKRGTDLAFRGRIWITKHEWALRRVDLVITKEANLNYIDGIKIQQDVEETEIGVWLPTKNRVIIDVAEISSNWAGMLAKFYTSHRNYKLNQPKVPSFYEQPVVTSDSAVTPDLDFWAKNRHDTLTQTELNVFRMIDTVKKMPTVRTYTEIAEIVVVGYKPLPKARIEVGPYISTYSNNNVEGSRFRIGGRTTADFSKQLVLSGFVAYGTADDQFKYEFASRYIFEKKRWTQLGFSIGYDLEQLALQDNTVGGNPLFLTFNRFGNLTTSRPFYQHAHRMFFTTRPVKGLESSISYEHKTYDPTAPFGVYKNAIVEGQSLPQLLGDFSTSEVRLNMRYARKEYFLVNDYKRIPVNTRSSPILTFQYTRSLPNFFASGIDYQKIQIGVDHTLNVGVLGSGRYLVDLGYIPGDVPYPLLRSHLGNQSVIYNRISYNLMGLFEFVSDRWVSLRYQQNFEGLLLNAIPYVRRAKWRMVAHTNILYGGMSDTKYRMTLVDGVSAVQRLGNTPYIEMGYGIENIFKIFRVDFVHRITYRDSDNARRFGVFGSVQFKL